MTNKTFEEKIADLAEKSKEAEKKRFHEAQTALTVILPFIMALGYDIFSFSEVEAEYSPKHNDKGEKVDYALKKDGKVVMLLEAKAARDKLTEKDKNQLYKYFTPARVKIAILTNGREAWFYADLDRDNEMDDEPRFKFNFQDINPTHIAILKKFQKNNFDENAIIKFLNALEHFEELRKLGKYPEEGMSDNDEKLLTSISEKTNGEVAKKLKAPILKQSIQANTTDAISPAISLFEETYKMLGEGADDHYTPISEEPRKTTFLKYVAMIQALSDVRKEVFMTAVNFYRGKNNRKAFVSIVPWKTYLQISMRIKKTEISGNKDMCTSWPSKHIGVGGTYINVDENSDHDYVLKLIKQAYDKENNLTAPNFLNPIEKYKKMPDYKFVKKEPRKTTFLQYVEAIFGLGNVKEKINTSYIAYRKNENRFASIVAQKRVLKIYLDKNKEELNDPRNLLRIYSDGYTYVDVDEDSDFDYIFRLIKQAYDKCA